MGLWKSQSVQTEQRHGKKVPNKLLGWSFCGHSPKSRADRVSEGKLVALAKILWYHSVEDTPTVVFVAIHKNKQQTTSSFLFKTSTQVPHQHQQDWWWYHTSSLHTTFR